MRRLRMGSGWYRRRLRGPCPSQDAAIKGRERVGDSTSWRHHSGTTNAANPFCYPVRGEDGQTVVERDLSDSIVVNIRKIGLDALIVIGGDGTLSIAERLSKKGIPLVGVPKTIDNDINGTVVTFGFDTAVNTAREALDRLHTTAESHRRVIVVEVMGRYAGWIALHSGIAGGADVILIPEIPYDTAKVADAVIRRELLGKRFSIVVVAEGAFPKGGTLTHIEPKKPGREQRLGGVGSVWPPRFPN